MGRFYWLSRSRDLANAEPREHQKGRTKLGCGRQKKKQKQHPPTMYAASAMLSCRIDSVADPRWPRNPIAADSSILFFVSCHSIVKKLQYSPLNRVKTPITKVRNSNPFRLQLSFAVLYLSSRDPRKRLLST